MLPFVKFGGIVRVEGNSRVIIDGCCSLRGISKRVTGEEQQKFISHLVSNMRLESL